MRNSKFRYIQRILYEVYIRIPKKYDRQVIQFSLSSSLDSWQPDNDIIKTTFVINKKAWTKLKSDRRLVIVIE